MINIVATTRNSAGHDVRSLHIRIVSYTQRNIT